MKIKAKIMDNIAVSRALARITHEIIERNQGVKDVCLMGIKTKGAPLADRLAENVKKFEGVSVPVGYLDITLHRDDLSEEQKMHKTADNFIPCDITDKTVVLVDDVLFTGRTARAAIESLFTFGRPKAVELATLIDRGHRELPFRADYVGKNVPTSRQETVLVRMEENDGETAVYICDK